jgi:hypothetical protein
MPKQSKQQNDRQWNTDQPKQRASAKSHASTPVFVALII